jgi:hypothetical protein
LIPASGGITAHQSGQNSVIGKTATTRLGGKRRRSSIFRLTGVTANLIDPARTESLGDASTDRRKNYSAASRETVSADDAKFGRPWNYFALVDKRDWSSGNDQRTEQRLVRMGGPRYAGNTGNHFIGIGPIRLWLQPRNGVARLLVAWLWSFTL